MCQPGLWFGGLPVFSCSWSLSSEYFAAAAGRTELIKPTNTSLETSSITICVWSTQPFVVDYYSLHFAYNVYCILYTVNFLGLVSAVWPISCCDTDLQSFTFCPPAGNDTEVTTVVRGVFKMKLRAIFPKTGLTLQGTHGGEGVFLTSQTWKIGELKFM